MLPGREKTPTLSKARKYYYRLSRVSAIVSKHNFQVVVGRRSRFLNELNEATQRSRERVTLSAGSNFAQTSGSKDSSCFVDASPHHAQRAHFHTAATTVRVDMSALSKASPLKRGQASREFPSKPKTALEPGNPLLGVLSSPTVPITDQ